MKNRSIVKLIWVICVMGLLSSCMGMQDTTPTVALMPEIQSFDVNSENGYDFELTATLAKEDAAKIVECGFYVSEQKSMQGAEKIVSKLFGQEFMAEVSLIEEGEKKHVCAYLSIGGDHVEICSEVKTIVAGEVIFEPEEGGGEAPQGATANCYIVSKSGSYKFPTVKGNSNESVGAVKSVEVLWESFGTSTAPNVGDLIKSVSYTDGFVTLRTSDTFKEGNAVIAAKDANGTILWSWHIWLTDQPSKCVYENNAGTMMDRNLGATSATPGEVGALGLLYQWGRKDPFLGSYSISSSVEAKSTITWPSAATSSSSRGTIAYATEHPTTFIAYNSNNYDWYYSGSSSTDDSRWQSTKTIYDPCPAGWRVPDGGSNGVWSKAGFDDQSCDLSDKGVLLGAGISSPATWYPAAGSRSHGGGSLINVGRYGYYWSVTPNGYGAYRLYFIGSSVVPTDNMDRASGQAVPCLQE